jgi:CDP-diacylglycerol--serine O-phosphatidyltransferase
MPLFNNRKSKVKSSHARGLRLPRLPIRRLRKKEDADSFAPPERNRGIYLLPNSFTTAALFCGFYAIVMAMNGQFSNAAVAIFAAMVLDATDGRVARLTNTQSEFGAQYDSLSDMVSFGAAPALIMYEWALRGMGKLGWLAAFVYCAGAALRLARFNTNITVVDKRFFPRLAQSCSSCLRGGLYLVDG